LDGRDAADSRVAVGWGRELTDPEIGPQDLNPLTEVHTMRKTALFLMFACIFAAGLAYADPDDTATMEVFVEVDANMTVAPGAAFTDLSSVQVGPIFGYIPFRVDANTQTCMFRGAASNLYKGDDPVNPEVPPILVSLPEGISFVCPDANPTNGQDNNAAYVAPFTVMGVFPGHQCEWVEFESSQNNHFSQDIVMEVTWIQSDPEKPMGEYSGYVEFEAMIVLP